MNRMRDMTSERFLPSKKAEKALTKGGGLSLHSYGTYSTLALLFIAIHDITHFAAPFKRYDLHFLKRKTFAAFC
jgi:hypothetical protein